VKSLLDENGITGDIDNRDEKIGRKIRDAEVKKIPFMVIVGEKEEDNNQLSLRKHGEGDIGTFELIAFVDYFQGIIKESLNK
jgi:threonyl-tRNA synthetase